MFGNPYGVDSKLVKGLHEVVAKYLELKVSRIAEVVSKNSTNWLNNLNWRFRFSELGVLKYLN